MIGELWKKRYAVMQSLRIGGLLIALVGLAVAKGGLITFTYYLAAEYGAQNVRANCILPGPVPTDLNAPFLASPEGRAAAAQMIPLGRVGALRARTGSIRD